MINEITCPACTSTKVAAIFYGMPRFTDEFVQKLDAGEIVLEGCEIVFGEHRYQFECQACGHRFDVEQG